ncbi:MAG: carboxylesterase family protein [Lachnospiraceae bacterium]|nr:carboxylesterase family protein [Lachnospiraceae bacterium]
MYPKKLEAVVRSDPDFPIVNLKYGRLRGILTDEVYIFRGIPYAKAGRFCPPQEPESWEGVRNARAYGAACAEVHADSSKDDFRNPRYAYPQSEDCHFLNIWTKTLEADAKLPVIVWIGGRGFDCGSATDDFAAEGENLARLKDVVVVSVNHRIGALGYMDLSSYGEPYWAAGNPGTMDLIAGLKWIQENILQFGGDPNRVTLIGQKGGAAKIQALLQTPAADGLYDRVCMIAPEGSREAADAGMGENPPGACFDRTPEEAKQCTELVLEQLKLTASTVREIEHVPFYRLAWAVSKAEERYREAFGKTLVWGPVADGGYYLGNGLVKGFRKEASHIPVMTDSLALSEALAANGNPVYYWEFSLKLPACKDTAPWPGAETPFLFHNASYMENTFIPEVTDSLENMMAGAMAAFADVGDPNHTGMPRWVPFVKNRLAGMCFDRTSGMVCAGETPASASLHDAREAAGAGKGGGNLCI